MTHRRRGVTRARRWVLPVLVLFLGLGHACEWPLATAAHAMSSHASDGHAHSDHDAPGNSLVSCDAVEALANTGAVQTDPGPDALEILPLSRPVSARWLTTLPDGSTSLADRPPLFLLYASLLI